MEVKLQEETGHLIIAVAGRLDTNTSPDFEKECMPYCTSGDCKDVVLDFTKLEYISSAGLRCMLSMAKKLKAAGGCLMLCGLSGLVEEVITMSGFDSFLPIFKNVDSVLTRNRA